MHPVYSFISLFIITPERSTSVTPPWFIRLREGFGAQTSGPHASNNFDCSRGLSCICIGGWFEILIVSCLLKSSEIHKSCLNGSVWTQEMSEQGVCTRPYSELSAASFLRCREVTALLKLLRNQGGVTFCRPQWGKNRIDAVHFYKRSYFCSWVI